MTVQFFGSSGVVPNSDDPDPQPTQKPAPVLPEPANEGGYQDALTTLLALLSKQSQADAQRGVQTVDSEKKEQAMKMATAQAAYQAMKTAQADASGGWMDTFFKTVVAVAAGVGTVVTAGAASPALAASIMAFGAISKSTQCFGDTSDIIGNGANIVGDVFVGNFVFALADGSSLTASIGTKTKAFDATVAMGFEMGGAVAKVFGNETPRDPHADPVATSVVMDAEVGGDVGTLVLGVDHANKTGDAAQDSINMKEAQMAIERISNEITDAINAVKDTHDAHDHASKTVLGAIETQDATTLAAVGGVRG